MKITELNLEELTAEEMTYTVCGEEKPITLYSLAEITRAYDLKDLYIEILDEENEKGESNLWKKSITGYNRCCNLCHIPNGYDLDNFTKIYDIDKIKNLKKIYKRKKYHLKKVFTRTNIAWGYDICDEYGKETLDNFIKKAEEDILQENYFVNVEFEDTTLIGMLFDNYEIFIPIETRKWIDNGLVGVDFLDAQEGEVEVDTVSYRHIDTTEFKECFKKLAKAISEKYNTKI